MYIYNFIDIQIKCQNKDLKFFSNGSTQNTFRNKFIITKSAWYIPNLQIYIYVCIYVVAQSLNIWCPVGWSCRIY